MESKGNTSNSKPVCTLTELQQAGRLSSEIDGREIVIFYHRDQVFALDRQCYHAGGPLQNGQIKDIEDQPCVMCPWHRYTICLHTGESIYQHVDPKDLKNPVWKTKGVKQRTHNVTVNDNLVFVELSDLNDKRESDYYSSDEYKERMGSVNKKR